MHITLVAALTVAMVVCLLISLATEEAANRLEENAELTQQPSKGPLHAALTARPNR